MWSALLGIRMSLRCASIFLGLVAVSLWPGAQRCPAQERADDNLPRPAAKAGENKTGESKSPGDAKATNAKPPDASGAGEKAAEIWPGFSDDISYLKGPDGKPV